MLLQVHFWRYNQSMLDELSHATVDLFSRISSSLLPTPSKPTYSFTIRDMVRVVQGIANVNGSTEAITKDLYFRLWIHEIVRVFCDRLVTDVSWVVASFFLWS
jgi:dynein heavy chain